MDYDFALKRCLLFAACIAIWWLLGGFSLFGLSGIFELDELRLRRALPKFLLLFLAGAFSVSFVDHTVGHMPPTSLRIVYILAGIGMMTIAVMLLLSFRVAVAP